MKSNKLKRFLASAIVLCMLVGLVPANAIQAEAKPGKSNTVETIADKEPIDAAVFFSDLHAMKNGNNSEESSTGYKKSIVTNMMTALKNTKLPFSSVTSVGDAFSSNEYASTGKTSIITGYIQSVLGDIPVNYVWSDHDRAALSKDDSTLLSNESDFVYGAGEDNKLGTDDDGEYYVYSLSMADMSTNNRYSADFHTNAEVTATIADFVTKAKSLHKDRPLFIASHQPLYDRRNDNGHALEWCNAINTVAENMDVAVLHGHNHKYDEAEDYYYAKGSTMSVCKDKNGNAENVEIQFTHLCAGYFEPSSTGSTSNTTRQGTVVVATIYDDSIKYTTYDNGGVYTGNYAVDRTVTRDKVNETLVNPEGYTLSKIEVSNIVKDTYFVGESLDMSNAVVTATYTKEGSEDITREISAQGENVADGYTVSGFDKTQTGKQTVVINYEGMTTSFEITVVEKEAIDNSTGVGVKDKDNNIINIAVTKKTETVAGYSAYVIYDIVPEDYVQGTEVEVTVQLDDSFKENGQAIVFDIEKNKSSVYVYSNRSLTFTTNHFSEYAVAQASDADSVQAQANLGEVRIVPITSEDELQDGEGYVLVLRNTELNLTGTLTANKISDANRLGLVDGVNTNHIWHYEKGKFYVENNNNPQWLYVERNVSALTTDKDDNRVISRIIESEHKSAELPLFNLASNVEYGFLNKEGTGNNINSGVHGWNSTDYNSDWLIYKFVQDTATLSVSPSELDLYKIAGMNQTQLNTIVKFNETVTDNYTVTYSPSDSSIVEVSTDGTVTGKNAGEAIITVSLSNVNGTTLTTPISVQVPVTVAATPHHYSIQLHKAELTEVSITEFEDDVVYYTYDNTTHTYKRAESFVAGTTYYTTPVIQGDEITEPIALKGIKAGDTYSVWAVVKAYVSDSDTEGKDLGALGNALSWTVSDTSIADINSETGVITFTGEQYGTFKVTVAYSGADGEVYIDEITISATESLYIVPGDGTDDFPEYPNEGAVRFDKTATAVGNFSETGIAQVELSMTGVPYTKDNVLDVVLMLDRSNSMTKTRLEATKSAVEVFVRNIAVNEDGTFTKNRIYIGDFMGGNPQYATDDRHKFKITQHTSNEEDGYQIIDSSEELDKLIAEFNNKFVNLGANAHAYGTEYAQSLAKCYDLLNSTKADGNTQACVFMSDGIPNVYQYGATSNDRILSSNDMTRMFGGNNYDTRSNQYKYEYYSSLMKQNGVTVYAVGLGLYGTNSSLSGASEAQCENAASILLNDISGPAGETEAMRDTESATNKENSYFFSVADEDAATGMAQVFDSISSKILDAATDVVVEDMIGNDYSVNFSLPEGVEADETEGLQEFYIQAVEYQLDANKERKGEPKVLENFTFNSNGTFKSHAVNGVTCNNCTHVTTENDKITAIDGTYFDYKIDSTGEYLNWVSEKLSTTELALQYFAHLDNSSDAVGTNQEVPAGTYYTNEYATLTYTNHKGNRVQEEFPIPQMTWNGAQVSYVFYLVNDAGQPVNRAGRVVPFAEAVYVTDVFTHHIIWNDLEQSAGLDANYLAEELVPDLYALYDDNASYNIHVYEDEHESNLNNHFVINGNVSDEYNVNNSWSNANTTYVFNNKSDAIKYNTNGAYITNDGSASTTSKNYLCKGDGKVRATISVATGNIAANFANQAYFTEIDGKYIRAASYVEGTTYYEISSASYTPVAGETHWSPKAGDSTSGGTIIDGHIYYIGENNEVYTIVQKSNGTEVREGFDFQNTTVAFAVVWKPELEPDAVVIDYGLDVVVDVAQNDAMVAGVVGVRMDAPNNVTINSGTYDASRVGSIDIKKGETKIATASVESLTSVRFSLDKNNSMNFNTPAKFYYESDVNYYDSQDKLQSTSMYSSVTVIPATTIYYEDNFVDFSVLNSDGTVKSETWASAGTTLNKAQDTDRPGESKIGESYDADNVYGYDSAYTECSKYSLGSARKINVNANQYGAAEFTFWGTGFDVISLTNGKTGAISVDVTGIGTDNADVSEFLMVDTYYSYVYQQAKEENGDPKVDKDNNPVMEWVVDKTNSVENSLYQIPVIKVADLPYGQYKVRIEAAYAEFFDHEQYDDASYDFYLDAIRIYDPANDAVSEDAYIKDDEANPDYKELRNLLIQAKDFNTSDDLVEGIIFVDTNEEVSDTALQEYINKGPNNEVYLKNGQAIAFHIWSTEIPESVQLGAKIAHGDKVIMNVGNSQNASAITKELKTATDMFYEIGSVIEWTAKDTDGYYKTKYPIIVSNNTENGAKDILSLTNVKWTYANEGTGNGPVAKTRTVEVPVNELQLMGSRSIAVEAYEALVKLAEPPVEEPPVVEPENPPVEEVKEPEVLNVKTNKTSYTVKDKVEVTVTTNTDASYVVVNGTKVTEFTETADTKVWTVKLDAEKTGKMTVEAVAYADDVASKAEKKTVTVKAFAPKTFKLTTNKSTVTAKDKIKATVTTSTDVDYVTINGKKVTKFTTDKKKTVRTWTLNIATSKAGKVAVKAVAYNKNGAASAAKTKNVTVKVYAPKKFALKTDKSKVKAGAKITATVTTSTDVKYVTINGKKVTKYTQNKLRTQKVWTLKLSTKKAGNVTVKAVAYNSNASASKAKTKTVKVTKK